MLYDKKIVMLRLRDLIKDMPDIVKPRYYKAIDIVVNNLPDKVLLTKETFGEICKTVGKIQRELQLKEV